MTFDFLNKFTLGLNDQFDQGTLEFFIRYFNLNTAKRQVVQYTIQPHIKIYLAFTIHSDLKRVTVFEKTYFVSVGGFELAYNDLHHAQQAVPELEKKYLGEFAGIQL